MSHFPSWWQISEEFPPRLFHTAAEVPAGWTRCKGRYDAETGQWVKDDPLDHDGDGKRGGSEPIDPMDLPAIAGFVRDGFDHDDPEGGHPPRRAAQAEPADEIVPSDEPGRDKVRGKRRKKGARKMGNENAEGIAKPQSDKPVSKPQEDKDATVRERGEDGTMRTGNRPTRR